MNEWLQFISSATTAVVAIVALFYAYKQIQIARSASFAERRPYIVPTYEVQESQNGPKKVFLVLTNFGNTPAKDVTLKFSDDAAWHYIKYAEHFPFLSKNNGISVIPPNSKNSYFVGNLSSNSDLLLLKSKEISVLVEFGVYEKSERISDPFRLSLKDFAGSLSLRNKQVPAKK